jgi:hypothetical protein
MGDLEDLDVGYDLFLALKKFPIGTAVRIAGSDGWPKRERIVNGLTGTIKRLIENGDGTVCAKVTLDKNKHRKKSTTLNVSWLQLLTVLDRIAQV